jgi:hypothetical protein
MRHAAPLLDQLDPMLAALRALPGLTEKQRGVFYCRSKTFLDFHEDPSGLYADVHGPHGDFARFKVDSAEDQAELVRTATDFLSR